MQTDFKILQHSRKKQKNHLSIKTVIQYQKKFPKDQKTALADKKFLTSQSKEWLVHSSMTCYKFLFKQTKNNSEEKLKFYIEEIKEKSI